MLPAPDSYRARVAPGQREAMGGLSLPAGAGPCPLASPRCPGRAGAGRVITRGEHRGGGRAAAAGPGARRG
jgi:hypothetical protein